MRESFLGAESSEYCSKDPPGRCGAVVSETPTLSST